MERLEPFLATSFECRLKPTEELKTVSDVAMLLKRRGYILVVEGNELEEKYDEDIDEWIDAPGTQYDIWVKAYVLNRDTGVLEESDSTLLDSNNEYSVVTLPYDSVGDNTISADCSEGLIRTKKEEWSGLGLYDGGQRRSTTDLYNHIFQHRN